MAFFYTARDLLAQHRKTLRLHKLAVIDGERRVTYEELLRLSGRYAALLKERGAARGDRVAVFLRRSVEAVAAFFATWQVGGVAVVINETLRARQARYMMDHSGASCMITDSSQLRGIGDEPWDSAVCLDRVESGEEQQAAEAAIGADLALIIYTSGSTGMPKGVMISHDNLLSGAAIVSDYLNLTERDALLAVLPFSFDYGLNQMLTALRAGGTLVIQRSLFPPDICRTLEREDITGLAGVPTLWLQLAGRQSPFLKTRFPHLRYITNSGGRLPEPIVRLIRSAHPRVQVYLMYGLTEAFRSAYLPPDEVDRRPASIGKAIPNVEMLVINDEGGACSPGEVGELVHRGANVAMGYWRDPEATARVFRPHPLDKYRDAGIAERVVFSGDLVKTDAEGYFYFVGRRDQLMKSRGFRVAPEEVEAYVASSKLVTDVVSFAVPSGADSDIVAAVIPLDPSTFRREALKEFCKNEMAEYMQPRVVWPMSAFPLTASGKPDRVRMREMYAEWSEKSGSASGAARTA